MLEPVIGAIAALIAAGIQSCRTSTVVVPAPEQRRKPQGQLEPRREDDPAANVATASAEG